MKIKRIVKPAVVIAVIMVFISVFGVLSFAATGKAKIKLISTIDAQSGTVYITDSKINIYQVPVDDLLKEDGIQNQYLIGKATTGQQGAVDMELEPGYYIFVEEQFVNDDIRYDAEPMYLEALSTTDVSLYLKHSVVPNETPTSTTPVIADDPVDLPFTGSSFKAAAAAVIALAAAMSTAIIVSRKENA